MRRIRYGKKPCPCCGFMVTKNAMGRASHIKFCPGPSEMRRRAEERARAKPTPFQFKPRAT